MAETSPHARCLACAFPFWEQLTPEEQERLCRFTRPVHYAKGARVHSPLESCVGILLLRSGQLRSYLLSEDGRDVTLYRLFGEAWRKTENWKLYLLSSHTEFERTFGKTADKKRKLYNGMIKCDVFMYGNKV